ncbi:MAG TPA: hypothetical protein VEC37_02325 [Bacillota bacterium]|nr:hypothetical protein [Bacillota bacterium]
MEKITTGAETPFAIRRMIVEEQRQRRAEEDRLRKASPEEQRKLAKTEDKNQTKEELKNAGRFSVKGVVNLGPNLPSDIPPRIGQWGINEGKETTLKDVALKVYKDVTLWKMLAYANGYARFKEGKVGEKVVLYLPDLAYNCFTAKNGPCLSQYVFVGCMIEKVKPFMQVSGNVEVNMDEAFYRQINFNGKKCTGKATGGVTLSYKEYLENINPKTPTPIAKTGMFVIATAEICSGLVSTIGGTVMVLEAVSTVVVAVPGAIIGGATVINGANTFVSGVNDILAILSGHEESFGQVNVLYDHFYKPRFGEQKGTAIYAAVDIYLGWGGTVQAFKKVTQTSKLVNAATYYRGNWAEGFVRDYAKLKISPPSWGEKVVKGSVVVRDGIIYGLDTKGAWFQLSEND